MRPAAAACGCNLSGWKAGCGEDSPPHNGGSGTTKKRRSVQPWAAASGGELLTADGFSGVAGFRQDSNGSAEEGSNRATTRQHHVIPTRAPCAFGQHLRESEDDDQKPDA